MESPESTLHCSFVVYLDQDASVLPPFLSDLRAFFQKFPLRYELIAALEKNATGCAEILRDFPDLQIHQNTEKLGRAESLRQGLNKAQSAYLVILNPEMSTPLGDSFKVLQTLMSDAEIDICWGERYSKKTGRLALRASRRHALEDTFNKILQEKFKTSSRDVLCEVGGFKLTAWQKIESSWGARKISGWYLAPSILTEAKRINMRIEKVFVHDAGNFTPTFSFWKERWHLLRQSIF